MLKLQMASESIGPKTRYEHNCNFSAFFRALTIRADLHEHPLEHGLHKNSMPKVTTRVLREQPLPLACRCSWCVSQAEYSHTAQRKSTVQGQVLSRHHFCQRHVLACQADGLCCSAELFTSPILTIAIGDKGHAISMQPGLGQGNDGGNLRVDQAPRHCSRLCDIQDLAQKDQVKHLVRASRFPGIFPIHLLYIHEVSQAIRRHVGFCCIQYLRLAI
mmetsp:Transcript_91904/g.231037  ORF Transcript_91904/g.231037 Transcript_91904/m.231037 type:complete len:217 (+) Transcript_91904:38-688(+)